MVLYPILAVLTLQELGKEPFSSHKITKTICHIKELCLIGGIIYNLKILSRWFADTQTGAVGVHGIGHGRLQVDDKK